MPRYSPSTISHFEKPHRGCECPDADLVGHGGKKDQGPFVALYLKTDGERVLSASFRTYGCPAAIAASSALCSLIEGRTCDQVAGITATELDNELGGLPRQKKHCLGLAVQALRNALSKRLVG